MFSLYPILLLESVLFFFFFYVFSATVTNHDASVCSHSVHVIYTGLVPEQTGCLFSGLLTAETSLSFRLIFFCVPASHSLLLSVLTDWLSDLSIPKVRLLAIDKCRTMPSLQRLLPLLFTLVFPPLYLPSLICHSPHFTSPPPHTPSTVCCIRRTVYLFFFSFLSCLLLLSFINAADRCGG